MSNEMIKSESSVALHQDLLEQNKAFFYLMKGKRDTQIKLFDDNKSFFIQDIINLNEKIQEKLLLHNVSNKVVSISIALSNNKIKSFGNWCEFVNEKWDTNDETESIIINWDFEVILPNRVHTIPQTHSLKVRIGRELRPNEILHLVMIGGDEFELEENSSQMACKVDFVNSILASELLDKVTDWYSSLQTKMEDNAINILLNKYNRAIRLWCELLIIISGVFLLYPFLNYFLQQAENNVATTNQIIKISFCITSILFLTFTIFTKISIYYSNKIDRAIDRLKGTPIFEITKGDNLLYKKILAKNKNLRKEVYMKLIVSILSSGILYFLSLVLKYIYIHFK
jgi:hypothetical protein